MHLSPSRDSCDLLRSDVAVNQMIFQQQMNKLESGNITQVEVVGLAGLYAQILCFKNNIWRHWGRGGIRQPLCKAKPLRNIS